MRTRAVAPAAIALLAVACSSGERVPGQAAPTPTASASAGSPTPTPTPTPRFRSTLGRIDRAVRARITYSWHRGCPVPPADLRFLTLTYWGFDGEPHIGEMIVHRDVARDVIGVFRKLFRARFRIKQVVLADTYEADDQSLLAADVTSAFNCRRSVGDPSRWSEHAYGRAIDINPLENPYVSSGGDVRPPAGRAFLDRSQRKRGMIHAGDVVVRAFEAIGWTWGGTYRNSKDYQHFSQSGR